MLQTLASIPGKWITIFDKKTVVDKSPVLEIVTIAILVLTVSFAGSAYIDTNLFGNPSSYVFVYIAVECAEIMNLRTHATYVLGKDRRSGMLDHILLAPRIEEVIVKGVIKAEKEYWMKRTRRFMFSFPIALSLTQLVFFLLHHELEHLLAISYLLASSLLINRIRLKMYWIVSARNGLNTSINHLIAPFTDPVGILITANLIISICIVLVSSPFNPVKTWHFLLMVVFISVSTLVQYFYLKLKFQRAINELVSIRKHCSGRLG